MTTLDIVNLIEAVLLHIQQKSIPSNLSSASNCSATLGKSQFHLGMDTPVGIWPVMQFRQKTAYLTLRCQA